MVKPNHKQNRKTQNLEKKINRTQKKQITNHIPQKPKQNKNKNKTNKPEKQTNECMEPKKLHAKKIIIKIRKIYTIFLFLSVCLFGVIFSFFFHSTKSKYKYIQ